MTLPETFSIGVVGAEDLASLCECCNVPLEWLCADCGKPFAVGDLYARRPCEGDDDLCMTICLECAA